MLFSKAVRSGMGLTQSSIRNVRGALFREINQPRRETDFLPPPSAKVKNMWSCTFIQTHIHLPIMNRKNYIELLLYYLKIIWLALRIVWIGPIFCRLYIKSFHDLTPLPSQITSGTSGSGKISFCVRLLQNLNSLCTERKYDDGRIWCYGEKTVVPKRHEI